MNLLQQKTKCIRLRLGLTAICLCYGLLTPGNSVAQDGPTAGSYQLQLTLNELLGEQEAARYQGILPPDELASWQIYLPENSSAGNPGVFVYVSPRSTGRIDPRWPSVMDEQNLIYIAADNSGNRKNTNLRTVLATLAVRILAKQYPIDSERIYISGFSGGGRVASMIASEYPEAFTGALYICGVNFWRQKQESKLERLLQNRFVFLTGSIDFNRDETRRVYRRYLKAGAQQSKLMIIPGMAHAHPDAEALTEALQFLSDGS